MAIHVQDDETDWLVREFARRRGLGITAAIRTAVREASEQEQDGVAAFLSRIQPVLDRARARKAEAGTQGILVDDKAFMDEMWGEKR